MKTNATYVTTYCNFPHRMRDGAPIGHECYVLPPRALEFERQGDTPAAIAVIQSAKPLRRHTGARVVGTLRPYRVPECMQEDHMTTRDEEE